MPDDAPPLDQFWLLTGAVPVGPFTVAQVHAELAAGRATWQTPACPVGGSAWLPLVQTAGVGPATLPRAVEDARPLRADSAAPGSVANEPTVSERDDGSLTPASVTSEIRSTLASDVPPSTAPNTTATIPESQPQTDAGGGHAAAEMNDNRSNRPNQFWLLVGTETTGPFRPAHIRAKLQSGELSPDAKARRVGADEWGPLTEAVGALPPLPARPNAPPPPFPATERSSAPSAVPPSAPTSGTPAPPSHATAATSGGSPERTGVAIGIGALLLLLAGVGYGAYWAYEQIRPYTATEVCKKLEEAKTAATAKKYTTPRMHSFVDALFADKSAADPNDVFEWTQEIDGPQPNTKLVGFKGTTFVPEAGQRVRMEGHFRAVRADGWKVDDMIVTGVEGAALPGPVSLVDEHRRDAFRPKGGPGTPTPPTTPGSGTRKPTGVEAAFYGVKDRVGWGGIVALVVLIGIGAAIREAYQKKAKG